MSAHLRRPAMPGVAVVLALLLAACGGAADAGDQVDSGHHRSDHAALESVVAPVEGAPEVTVTAADIEFAPTTIELTAGEPTNVTVVNEGQARHDFTLEAAGVHVNVGPGDSVTTAVTVDEPGSYRALCTEPGHEQAGMVIDVEVM